MKKLLIILSLLLMLSMTLVSAQSEPVDIVNVTTFPEVFSEIQCSYFNEDLWCAKTSFGTVFKIIDLDTFLISNVTIPNTIDTTKGDLINYSNELYRVSNAGSFKILANGSYSSITNKSGSASSMSCDLRPSTDEIYCWDNDYDISKYDIGADTWTSLATNTSYPNDADNEEAKCLFRNSNEFWCFGGNDQIHGLPNADKPRNETMQYFIDTNTSVFYEMADKMNGLTCRWYNDTAYCYGYEDWSEPQDTIIYFNPNNNSTGILSTTLTVPMVFYAKMPTVGFTDYLVGGFITSNWDESNTLFRIDWEISCVENWTASFTTCTIGDNQTLIYTDENACGTFGDLPVENGTVSSCNFCTPTFVESSLECVTGDSERDITYDYTNSCCTDTGLPTDCTITANTTESCIGIHESSDVPALVIDFGVELGVQYIAFAGLIALIGLGAWAVVQWRKK